MNPLSIRTQVEYLAGKAIEVGSRAFEVGSKVDIEAVAESTGRFVLSPIRAWVCSTRENESPDVSETASYMLSHGRIPIRVGAATLVATGMVVVSPPAVLLTQYSV